MIAGGKAAPAALAGLCAAALLWGAAEATLFFLVADILLTFGALRFGRRTGLAAALAAAFGSMMGGLLMRHVAARDAAAALSLLGAVPFLPAVEIERGLAGMADPSWPLAMLKGSVTGIPYKVYAVGAGVHDVPAALFALVTLPVRLVRFVAATMISAWLGERLANRFGRRGAVLAFAAFWVLFYGAYWLRMSALATAG